VASQLNLNFNSMPVIILLLISTGHSEPELKFNSCGFLSPSSISLPVDGGGSFFLCHGFLSLERRIA
jgi:hypothetical protein